MGWFAFVPPRKKKKTHTHTHTPEASIESHFLLRPPSSEVTNEQFPRAPFRAKAIISFPSWRLDGASRRTSEDVQAIASRGWLFLFWRPFGGDTKSIFALIIHHGVVAKQGNPRNCWFPLGSLLCLIKARVSPPPSPRPQTRHSHHPS